MLARDMMKTLAKDMDHHPKEEHSEEESYIICSTHLIDLSVQ